MVTFKVGGKVEVTAAILHIICTMKMKPGYGGKAENLAITLNHPMSV